MTTATTEGAPDVRLIPIEQLQDSPLQHRETYEDLEDLTESIRQVGILQPLLARPAKKGKHFELVFGHRRLRAARAAELTAVPCHVRELTNLQVLEAQLVENLQRADVHPLEEARGYHRLVHEAKYDVARIAERVGRSAKYIYDRMKLLSLTEETQGLFQKGKITAGHAILLARLKPADQARAVEHGLFQHERLLFTPEEEYPDEMEPEKPVSVRELQGWIDEHVRFDLEAEDLPDLFPEAHGRLQAAREEAEKVVQITWDYSVKPEVRDPKGPRIYGPRSWKKADQACEHAVTGVIVAGAGRGEAFKVCIDKKKCEAHWGKEQREAAKRRKAMAGSAKTGGDRWKREEERRRLQREKEEAERERWKKARPALRKAVAEALSKAPAPTLLAVILNGLHYWGTEKSQAAKHMPVGPGAQSMLQHLAFIMVARELQSSYIVARDFPKTAKKLGINARKILDQAAPVQTSAKAGAKGKGKSKSPGRPRRQVHPPRKKTAPRKAAKPAAKGKKKPSARKRKS